MGAMGTGRILMAVFMIAASVMATDQPTVTFSRSSLSVDLISHDISYGDYPNVQVAGGLSLANQMFFIPLSTEQTTSDISFQADTQLLGSVDPALLTDIPTSLTPERYTVAIERQRNNRPGLTPVEVIDETTIQGQRYARVQIFPVSIDAEGTIAFNSAITIRVAENLVTPQSIFTSEQIATTQASLPGELSPTGTGPEYLIITSPALAPAMERLAAFKTATGISTEVKLVENLVVNMTGRDMAERLREALKVAYQAGCRYVLLAGDETQVPIRYAYPYGDTPPPALEDIQICDLYFADLTGNWNADNDDLWGERYSDQVDQTPELMVGRLPFASDEQAENYVDKLIVYETNPGGGDGSYLNSVMFFTSDQMRDPSFGSQHEYVAAAFPNSFAVDTTTGVEQSTGLDPNPTNLDAPSMVNVLSNGYGIVNVQAHGAAGQFAVRTSGYDEGDKSCIVSDSNILGHGPITGLAENDKTGFWYTLACDNGGFDLDTPPAPFPAINLVQTMLGLKRSGAVASVAYSRYGWVALSYLQQKTFFDSLLAHPDRPAIAALNAEKAVHASFRDLVYGQNFYGDPTVHIYTSVPKQLAVETAMDNDNLLVIVTADMIPSLGATVIVSQNGQILGKYSTDANGRVNLGQSLTGIDKYTIAAVKTGCSSSLIGYLPYIATDVDEGGHGSLPSSFALAQNYPNPFNPSTVIRFSLPTASHVKLTVYNVLGQEAATVIDGERSAGEYHVVWDASAAASGIYYYRLSAESFVETKKMVLIK